MSAEQQFAAPTASSAAAPSPVGQSQDAGQAEPSQRSELDAVARPVNTGATSTPKAADTLSGPDDSHPGSEPEQQQHISEDQSGQARCPNADESRDQASSQQLPRPSPDVPAGRSMEAALPMSRPASAGSDEVATGQRRTEQLAGAVFGALRTLR